MTTRQIPAGVLLGLLLSAPAFAQAREGVTATAEEFEAKLGYRTGTIALPNGMATIRLPGSFRFIGPEGSRRLLTEAWGNPPDQAADVLGMLIPSAVSPLTREGWGIVITYEEDGYVDDSDAATINYPRLFKEMQEASVTINAHRQRGGFEPVTLVGWAETPSYDAAAHKLYWATELKFGAEPIHTLNYKIRILGRRGVLVLNAVAQIGQLASIRSETRNVLEAVEFNDGHRYSDYRPGTDKAAAYGITGLIAGTIAAKTGLFKMLLALIIALKKLIVVAVIALVAAIRRLFGGGATTPSTSSRGSPDAGRARA